jgi:hypothetical protein
MKNEEAARRDSSFFIFHLKFFISILPRSRRLPNQRPSMKRLLLSALTTDEVHRVAPRPGIRRVANRTKRFCRQDRALAVVARQRQTCGIRIHFTTDFIANRATPAHCHFGRNTSRIQVTKS